MAKFQHSSAAGDLQGQLITDGSGGSHWRVEGDISGTIAEVKQEREAGRNTKSHFQKMCSIPNIVVLELNTKYNLDILDPEFMHDPAMKKRLVYLLKTEYPDLLIMT
jgi:hypothetical protein